MKRVAIYEEILRNDTRAIYRRAKLYFERRQMWFEAAKCRDIETGRKKLPVSKIPD